MTSAFQIWTIGCAMRKISCRSSYFVMSSNLASWSPLLLLFAPSVQRQCNCLGMQLPTYVFGVDLAASQVIQGFTCLWILIPIPGSPESSPFILVSDIILLIRHQKVLQGHLGKSLGNSFTSKFFGILQHDASKTCFLLSSIKFMCRV